MALIWLGCSPVPRQASEVGFLHDRVEVQSEAHNVIQTWDEWDDFVAFMLEETDVDLDAEVEVDLDEHVVFGHGWTGDGCAEDPVFHAWEMALVVFVHVQEDDSTACRGYEPSLHLIQVFRQDGAGGYIWDED